jgi:hypothetical protein
MSWKNPYDEKYQVRWQHAFGLSARAHGMVHGTFAQRYISQLRAMGRRLRRPPAPTWSDWKKIFGEPPSRNRDRWILDRCKKRIDSATKRGDTSAAMERRNLFDAWRGHSYSRGIAKYRQRPRKFKIHR